MSAHGVVSPAAQLQERLNDPEVAASLNRLLDHLDTLAFAVESVEGFVGRGEVIAESVASSVADLKNLGGSQTEAWVRAAPQVVDTGVHLAQATRGLHWDELAHSQVLQRLTEPQTLETLNRLLDKLPFAEFLLEAFEGFLRRGETVSDNFGEAIRELNLEHLRLDSTQFGSLLASLPKLKAGAERLLASELMDEGLPKVIEAGVSMVESGMLDQRVVSVLGQLGKQSVQTYQEVRSQKPAPVGGMFGLLRATKDPDVQKTLGFAFAYLKAFAKHLP